MKKADFLKKLRGLLLSKGITSFMYQMIQYSQVVVKILTENIFCCKIYKNFLKNIDLAIDFIMVKCYYDTTVKQTEEKRMAKIWQRPSEIKRHRH